MDGLGTSIFTLTACIGAFIFGSQIGPVLLDKRMMHAIARWVRLNRYGRFSPARRRALLEKDKQWQAEHGSPGRTNHADESQDNGHDHAHAQNGHHGIDQNNNAQTTSPYREHTILENELKANYPILVLIFLSLVFLSMWAATGVIAYYVPRWRGIVMFALLFSPPGVWLRFYLSRLNLRNSLRFPLGTFIANIFGTAILAMLLALQYTPGRSRLHCQILQGWGDGFCGTLTTVSTFIVEIRKLERRHAYTYVVISWIAGQAVMLLILGSVDFARGGLERNKCAY
jgi:fluoride ion exporter CrcB/FEX